MELKTNQHSVYSLTYHVVFVTKYRRRVLDSEIRSMMMGIAKKHLENNGGSLLGWGGEEDHIHMLIELPPQVAPATAVCVLKTQMSKEARKQFPSRIREKLWKDVLWSPSYFISTTGGAPVSVLEQYIRQQGAEKPKKVYRKRK